jgi:excisionase family DNA binding protein
MNRRRPTPAGPAEAARADVAPVAPRLLDLEAAAKYLGGISSSTLRALIADGHIRAVRLPSVRHPGVSGRRLLIDVSDLDAAVARWKADR